MAIKVGSVCSGIEAASVALKSPHYKFTWFSEIEDFPSEVLAEKYPKVENVGDMNLLPDLLTNGDIESPDMICGGTPCQAFSLAGLQNGLDDDRGNLTLKFIDIIDSNDKLRTKEGEPPTVVLWENVLGVLKDKTNAFGCFLSKLAGFSDVVDVTQWSRSGIIRGPKRNVAWRVLDAKHFGLPHQRKRVYVLAGGKDFHPENIIFDQSRDDAPSLKSQDLEFVKQGHKIELFRSYTDCLYAAYGTKWNGNAAAYNGSLYVSQNDRLRRLTPLECERLMGFPDHYTKVGKSRPTNRYKALGNSWAIPVIEWIGDRILKRMEESSHFCDEITKISLRDNGELFLMTEESHFGGGKYINTSDSISCPIPSDFYKIIDTDAEERFYISPVGCKGILRRSIERSININPRLKLVLEKVSSQLPDEEIERISKIQPRGKFSLQNS